jgi:hypothetical protein
MIDNQATADEWEDLKINLKAGNPVYAPGTLKRKWEHEGHIQGQASTFDQINSDTASLPHQGEGPIPLTDDEIEAHLSNLRDAGKLIRQNWANGRKRKAEVKDELEKLLMQKKTVDAAIPSRCVTARNNYAREAIRKDFAMGLKE